jgi:hypothetical protein
MKIYIYIEDNTITDISLEKKDLYDLCEVDNIDFFTNYRFYYVDASKKVKLKPIYKKLDELEYLVVELQHGSLMLAKPFIEHIDADFIKFKSDKECSDALTYLNNYYYYDKSSKTLKEDPIRKNNYQKDAYLKLFREKREKAFKKWDVIKTNSLIGLADPVTEEEKTWYLEMLDYPNTIESIDTLIPSPEIPERFK